jgi:hypothetical protein
MKILNKWTVEASYLRELLGLHLRMGSMPLKQHYNDLCLGGERLTGVSLLYFKIFLTLL